MVQNERKMPLTGTFERTIDEKLRLAVPKPFKDIFQVKGTDELFLAPGNEGCLAIYSTEGFDRFARRLANVSPGRANVRNFLRLFYARAERVVLDKQRTYHWSAARRAPRPYVGYAW